MPEQKRNQAVEVVLQEATEILTAASKGCGSYAKPILRHVTAVADAVKKDGVQVSSICYSASVPQCLKMTALVNCCMPTYPLIQQ